MLDAAQERANAIAPLPDDMPSGAAVKASVIAMLLGGAMLLFLDVGLGAGPSLCMVIALSAAVAYFDCRQRWRRNSRELRAAIDYLEFVEQHSRR